MLWETGRANSKAIKPEKESGRKENRRGPPYPIVRIKFPAFLIEFESHEARKGIRKGGKQDGTSISDCKNEISCVPVFLIEWAFWF